MVPDRGGTPPRPRRPPPEPEPLPLAVLYEDDWVLVVDKPGGMVVHPTYRNWSGTLLNGLLWTLRDRRDAAPRIVTRLDKETSGVVVVALSGAVHARLQREMAAGRIRKEYLAVVHGAPAPPRGSITFPLGRSAADRRRVVVDPAGRCCRTDYEVLERADGASLVRCDLITGRTHQIRVHFAACGWPIVGDRVYGRDPYAGERQALHAWRVSMPHPAGAQRLTVEARPPADVFHDAFRTAGCTAP